MRQDKVCAQLVAYLHDELGVPYDNIVVLIALGTHRKQTDEELKLLASAGVYEKVRVLNHDCMTPDLKYLGTTSRGTEVW
jgi:nickel-dependent lactate racemase